MACMQNSIQPREINNASINVLEIAELEVDLLVLLSLFNLNCSFYC